MDGDGHGTCMSGGIFMILFAFLSCFSFFLFSFGRGYDSDETKRSMMMFMLCSCNDDWCFFVFWMAGERVAMVGCHVKW
jgi:hypothetical protein